MCLQDVQSDKVTGFFSVHHRFLEIGITFSKSFVTGVDVKSIHAIYPAAQREIIQFLIDGQPLQTEFISLLNRSRNNEHAAVGYASNGLYTRRAFLSGT